MCRLKVFALSAALVGLIVVAPRCVFACTCGPLAPKHAYERSTAVFVGPVTHISGQATSSSRGRSPVTVTFFVLRTLKGPRHRVVAVSTPRDSASCGYPFRLGGLYLVYAHGLEDALEVTVCSRTRPLPAALGDLLALGEGRLLLTAASAATAVLVICCRALRLRRP